jgi:hypothetical protein
MCACVNKIPKFADTIDFAKIKCFPQIIRILLLVWQLFQQCIIVMNCAATCVVVHYVLYDMFRTFLCILGHPNMDHKDVLS